MMSSGPSVTPHRSGTFTEPSGFTYRSIHSRAPSAAARSISRSASAHAGAGVGFSMRMVERWPARSTAANIIAAAALPTEAVCEAGAAVGRSGQHES